ncbi:MAG: hypothetical protein FJY29_00310 [Betaproteobacteria bacterium]|nr:hypothetical protein [Betaproteobacteria bacterium]
MILRAVLLCLGLTSAVACKAQDSDASTSAAGSQRSAAISEQCGTVMLKGSDIVFQVSGNNSENNLDYVLDPQDGASSNILQDMATKLSQACIKAEFSSAGKPLIIKSASVIREVK